MARKVLFIIAPQNFRDEEYFIPKSIIEKNGFDITTASYGVKVASSMFGKQVNIDIDISKLDIDLYEAIIFVGGNGALNYVGNPIINNIITKADDNRILIAAICIAPAILARSGILKDLDATIWNEDGQQAILLEQGGANYTGKTVEEHNNFITANGPAAAQEFAERIIEYLYKH